MTATAPIFVVGFQRSGTTLLQSLLGAHPNIAAPPEFHFIFRIVRLGRVYGNLEDDEVLRRVIHDTLNPPADMFADCGFVEETLFERARSRERTMRSVFETIMSDYAERLGKRRWSEKSPSQPAADILGLFPEAQLIHIIRDPRDAIASTLGKPWTRAAPDQLAREWRATTIGNIRSGSHVGPAQFMQVRYEDLTKDAGTVLRSILTFLNEPFDDRLLTDLDARRTSIAGVTAQWHERVQTPITPATEGGWRTRLSKRDRVVVQAMLHREIATLGYEPVASRTIRVGTLMGVPSALIASLRARHARRVFRNPQKFDRAMRAYLDDVGVMVGRQGQT